MEETFTGYATEMSVATHNKGSLTFISELYLFFGEICGYREDVSWFFIRLTFHDLPPNLPWILYCGHGGKIKYILCCSIG